MRIAAFLFYQLLTLLALPVFLIFLGLRLAMRSEYRADFLQRFGLYAPKILKTVCGRRVIWVHAVSLGEVLSATLFVEALRRQYPRAVIVFSSGTPTGRAAAQQHVKAADLFIYLPFDFWWCVGWAVRRIQPSLFIFLETELWPNLLCLLRARAVPAMLINGRLSERSVRRYRAVRFFLSSILKDVALFLMQTEADAAAIRALGAPSDRVRCTGNMKYDQAIQNPSADLHALRAILRLKHTERLMMAGSPHVGEAAAILAAYRIVADTSADGLSQWTLLMAPRHLTQLAQFEQAVTAAGYRSIRKQALFQYGGDRPPVILLDTLGEMAAFYEIAELIFVGGSLVPIGGHNVLEAAAFKKPVFFGPHMSNFREISEQMKASGGGVEVSDGEELGRQMACLLDQPAEYARRGEQAYQVVLANRGAVQRNVAAITPWMPTPPAYAEPRMTQIWKQRGGLSEALLLPLTGLSILYGIVCRMRIGLYRQRWIVPRKVSCCVISVGNLTVGGTGKTPLVIFLAEQYQRMGYAVAIVSLGYGGNGSEPVTLVSDGLCIPLGAADVGDEPYLMAQRLPNVPIMTAKSRYLGCQRLLSQFKLDVILLDDGFQHLSLHRDLNILLMDAANPFGNGALLPRGPLREPRSQMRRADLVILTRYEEGLPLPVGLEDAPPVLRCKFVPSELIHLTTGAVHPLSLLAQAPVFAFCGIGNPGAFRALLTRVGAEIIGMICFQDHHPYTPSDLQEILRRAGPALRIVTTEKDGVKMKPLLAGDEALFVLRIQVQFLEAREVWAPLLLRKTFQHA